MQYFLTAIAFLLPTNLLIGSASAAERFEGRWAEKPEWCKNTNRANDEAPITITRSSIETFASSCRVISVQRRAPLWRIRTSCRDEGQSEKEKRTAVTFFLRVEGDRLAMRDSTGVQNYQRCPR